MNIRLHTETCVTEWSTSSGQCCASGVVGLNGLGAATYATRIYIGNSGRGWEAKGTGFGWGSLVLAYLHVV